MLVIAPGAVDSIFFIILILLGNIVFLCYDTVLPRMEILLIRYLGKILK